MSGNQGQEQCGQSSQLKGSHVTKQWGVSFRELSTKNENCETTAEIV